MNNTKNKRFDALTKKTRRPLEYVLLSLVLFAVGGAIIYNNRNSTESDNLESPPYEYTIKQNVTAQPFYLKNSFYGSVPDSNNTAFLTELTDKIDAKFNYSFSANAPTNLTYQYQASAEIKALYGSNKTTETSQSTVWSKQSVLLKPVSKTVNGSLVNLDQTLQIPYAEYYKQMEQFRNAYSAAVTSELLVTYTVQVTGQANGAPFKDTKVSKITVPLDQQIYTMNVQFEKSARGQLAPASKKGLADIINTVKLPLAVGLIVIGLGSIIYGLRKRLVLSPYQRKLARIYRYHEGIIVRTKQAPDLVKKNIVTLNSFDDILNLEQELKTPIIASQLSDYTTHFFVTQDDIIYVYTLGIPIPFKDSFSATITKDQ